MAQVSFTGVVLEINSQTSKKDPAIKYHTLIMYERGKPYPELTKINLKPEQVDIALQSVGKILTVTAELSIFRDRASYYFREFGK